MKSREMSVVDISDSSSLIDIPRGGILDSSRNGIRVRPTGIKSVALKRKGVSAFPIRKARITPFILPGELRTHEL